MLAYWSALLLDEAEHTPTPPAAPPPPAMWRC
jgi:hypothetical protein